ncbi:MAG: DUF2130 domain-containing protein [Candidatus Acidiferrales bacterium]
MKKALKAKKYPCPVCGTLLSRSAFEKALKIHKAKEKHVQDLEMALKKRAQGMDEEVENAIERGRRGEKRRGERLMAGQKRQIRTLLDRVAQLEKGTTPQTDGLEFEDKLLARLKREFSGLGDLIEPKGKLVGDIVHTVRYEGKEDAGKITYECKRTRGISGKHVQQAYQAKQACHADFAILVTTGKKKRFTGLMEWDGVLVVAPLGVIPLAALLRANLIEMLRAKITTEQRAKIAQRVLKYITSPQLKNPIEEVIQLSTQLQNMVKDEYDDHVDTWKKRLRHYSRIQWDTTQIQVNFQRILHGKEPKHVLPPKPQLLLPGVAT